MSQILPLACDDWTNVFLLDSMSSNAANDICDEQNLHEIEVTLPKERTVPDWSGCRACESRFHPPISLSVNALALAFAPRVARPKFVEGTYGFELRRRWYAYITVVTRIAISAICVIIVERKKKNPLTKVEHHSQHEGKRYWRLLRK